MALRRKHGHDIGRFQPHRATQRGGDGLERIYNSVDTCAAEFEAATPYYYSSHEQPGSPGEIRRGEKPSVVILGSGPNRIGQGIEFDYCCVHAAMTVRDCGKDAVMINCNPETVSTDYDTSDRLYFEPLTLEHVLAACRESPVSCRMSTTSARNSDTSTAVRHSACSPDRLGRSSAASSRALVRACLGGV